MSNPVTIHDIAREAKVSPSTVSRVLNGNVPVAPEKRAAVLAVIKQLNYQPNAIARGLVRRRTSAVGVLTQSIASPFYGEILVGIENGFAGSGYHAIFASGNLQTAEELAALERLSQRRVDALILLTGSLPDQHLLQVAAEFPLIVVGRTIAELEDRCMRVDDYRAAYEATRYLVSLGHRRIAHIAGPSSHQDTVDRRAGYQAALEDSGLVAEPQLIVEGSYTEQSGLLAMQALLSRGEMFSAIFAGNDQMAYGARLALYRNGIRVPEDMSLVGFDDQYGSAYTTPPLTTVRQPAYEMGQAAARAILRLLEGQPAALPRFETELIIRESAVRLR